MAIQTVFLDAGGVLVFPNWARVAATLATYDVHVDAEALAAAEPLAKKRIDVGETIQSTDDTQRGWMYFNLVLQEAGIALTPATDAALADLRSYHAQDNLWEVVAPDARPSLARLRAHGSTLVVVSNANGRLRHLFDRLGLADLFDVLLDSFEEGVEKPDPRLFEIALDRAGAQRETTLHVGDLYHVDVLGARAAGLHAALLDPFDLYAGFDCPRIHTLADLCDLVVAGEVG